MFAIKVIGVLLIATSVAVAVPDASDLETAFQEGIQALEKQEYPQAQSQFETTLEQLEEDGKGSAAVHYNLALALWHQKSPARSVWHLLKSSAERLSPFRIQRDLNLLEQLQSHIGIRDNLAEDRLFQIQRFLNRPWIMILFSLGGWSLFLAALAATKMKNPGPAISVFGLLALFFLVSGGTGVYLSRQTVAVLNGPTEGAKLFRSISSEGEEPTKLPSGTVVRLDQKEGRHVHIASPIAGWVLEDEVIYFR